MTESEASQKSKPGDRKPRGAVRAYGGFSVEDERGFGNDAATLMRILRLSFRYKWRLSAAIAATLVASAFQLMIPRYLGAAVDSALGLLGGGVATPEEAKAALWSTAAILLGVSVLRGVFTLIHNYNGEALGHLMAYDLRREFYGKLQQLSFSFHDRVHTGELITRGMLDLEGVRMFMNTAVLRVFLLSVLIGAGTYLLLSIDISLGLLSLSFVPFVAWHSSVTRLRLRGLWLALQDRMANLGQVMDENLTGIRVVRAFGAERHEMSKYDEASNEAMALADERIKVRVSSVSAMTFAYFVSMGLVLWVGGLRVLDGTMTVGTLTVFLTFITILQLPVRQLGLVVNSIARASTCGARLFAVLDLEPAIRDAADARPLDLSGGTVEFRDVSFAYQGEGAPPVLNGVSFRVERGKTLGIVGPPGSGKSTIAHLLPRYYDVKGGRILIDGQDIRDVTLASLRDAVKVVQQDPFLFTSSLENNVAYGDPWVDDESIERAASLAQIDGFVNQLPDGYRTLVGERGVSLSGGQKQRLAIARAAILDAAVMVFDDSTAAIDAGTERRIRQALKAHTDKCATIIISHRLGGLRHADEIVFLEAGRIVERGTHESLVAAGGRYAALFALQSRTSDDPALEGAVE